MPESLGQQSEPRFAAWQTVAALSEISLVRTKPCGQMKAMGAVAFVVHLGF